MYTGIPLVPASATHAAESDCFAADVEVELVIELVELELKGGVTALLVVMEVPGSAVACGIEGAGGPMVIAPCAGGLFVVESGDPAPIEKPAYLAGSRLILPSRTG